MENITLMKQSDKAMKYVVNNAGRLSKKFSNRFFAVEYRDDRGV